MVDASGNLQNNSKAELGRLRMLQEKAISVDGTVAMQNVSVLELVSEMNKYNVSSFKVNCNYNLHLMSKPIGIIYYVCTTSLCVVFPKKNFVINGIHILMIAG